MRFHGNGTSSYNLSHSPQEGTHISLYFQPDSYSGVLLTDAMNNTLQLENGHLKWSSGDQELTATGLNIYLDEWYQVEASKYVLRLIFVFDGTFLVTSPSFFCQLLHYKSLVILL